MKFLSIVFILLVAASVVDAAPKINWHDRRATERVVFMRGRGSEASVLVEIPYASKGESAVRAFRDDGREIPVSVVHQSRSNLHVLVRTGAQREKTGDSFYIYYGNSVADSPKQMVNEDTAPVTVEVFNMRSRSIPTSWERMRFMISTQEYPAYVRTQESISEVARPQPGGGAHSRHRRDESGGTMVHISTHIVIPEDGLYRFALNCNDAGFVMLDRKVHVAWPGRHTHGEPHEGRAVFLSAGPHMLEIYGASASVTRAEVSMAEAKSGGNFTPVESMSLVSSAVPVAFRLEKKDKTIHAGFAFSVGHPYRFRGMSQIFVPVALEDFSSNDLSSDYTVKWFPSRTGVVGLESGNGSSRSGFQTGEQSLTGGSLTHWFDSTGLHSVTVEVRDSLGFVSSLEQEVDTRNLQYREYAVSAVPVNVFPCTYGSDIVEPSIRVTMSGAENLSFLLEWKLIDAEGKAHAGSSSIQASQRAQIVKMFSARAEEVGKLEWELSHRGYSLEKGTMKFCRFPFKDFPERAAEDRLYDRDGVQLVYVSSRGSPDFKQRSIGTAHLKSGVLCLDDILSSVRPLAGGSDGFGDILSVLLGMDKGAVKTSRVSTRGAHNLLGAAGILLDAAIKTEASGGVAVLSLGQDHFLAYDMPDQFERMLAGVTDILLSRKAMRTVLVTMPPMGKDREVVRKYAVAARRVADARGVPVADLFSGFMGMGEDVVLFGGDGVELSDEGLKLAAQIVARTIIAGYRMEGED